MKLVTDVYRLTQSFPKEEIYSLTSQIRRSAVSIPSNISEGAARNSDKEYIQFLYIALGSTAELETQLLISKNLNYLTDITEIMNGIEFVRKLLLGLIKYLKNK